MRVRMRQRASLQTGQAAQIAADGRARKGPSVSTIFYRDGAVVPADQVLDELREGAGDAGVPLQSADALFAGALAGDAGDCVMLEDLMPGLECITQIGFGAPDFSATAQ